MELEGEVREEAEAEASAEAEAAAAAAGRAVASGTKCASRLTRSSLAAEFLDRPFVPRIEGESSEESSEGHEAAAGGAGGEAPDGEDVGAEEAVEIAAAAAGAQAAALALPAGTAVVVCGLSGDAAKYNGTHGVVVSGLHPESERQGVRLEAPFQGKRLHARPANMRCEPPPTAGEVETTGTGVEADDAARLRRHARALGLTLDDLELGAGSGVGDATAPGRVHTGFRLNGDGPRECLAAALRCAQRDMSSDLSGLAAAEAAHTALREALDQMPSSTAAPAAPAPAPTADADADSAAEALPPPPRPHRPPLPNCQRSESRRRWHPTRASATVPSAHAPRRPLWQRGARRAFERAGEGAVS